MQDFYAKLALEKCEELERRIKKLEIEKSQNVFKELLLVGEGGYELKNYKRSFKFLSLKTDEIGLSVNGTLTTKSAQVLVYVNGIKVKSVYVSAETFSIGFKCTVDKGEVDVMVEILYYLAFNLESLSLSVRGAVDNYSIESRLSVVNLEGQSIILLKTNNLYTLYSYVAGEIAKKLELEADDMTLLNGLTKVGVAALQQGVLSVSELDLTSFSLGEPLTVADKIVQISGGKAENGYIVYAIKGCRLFSYQISESAITESEKGYTAKRVDASTSEKNVYILTDYNFGATLIKE